MHSKKFPARIVEGLSKPESNVALAGILTHHVVAGKYDLKTLAEKIKTTTLMHTAN